MIGDVSPATQADAAQAYATTYTAWESCASNMDGIRKILAPPNTPAAAKNIQKSARTLSEITH